jgi:hypothetical protein
MGAKWGTYDVLLVVGGAPVLGAPVADAEQQSPPAGAHGGGGGGGGGERGGERSRRLGSRVLIPVGRWVLGVLVMDARVGVRLWLCSDADL